MPKIEKRGCARALLLLGMVSFTALTSCFPTKAVIDPYSYASKSSKSRIQYPHRKRLPHSEETSQQIPKTPLALAQVLDIALANNPSTQELWADAKIAAAQYGEAQSSQFPTVSGSYIYQRSRSLGGASSAASSGISGSAALLPVTIYQSQWGPQLELSYTLLDCGQRSASIEVAKEGLLQANYQHNWSLQTVANDVSTRFYDLQYQEALLKANEENVVTAQTTYDATKLELASGTTDLSDTLQAHTQLLQAQIALITQKQTVLQTKAALLTTMGLEATEEVSFERLSDVPPLEGMLEKADDLLAYALENRDDLLAQEANVKAQESAISLAIRQFLPTVSYNLSYGETSYTKLGSDGYDFTNLLVLNIPLFSGFSNLNSLKTAVARKEKALASLQKARLQVIEQVTISHKNVFTTCEEVRLSNDYLEISEKEYTVAIEQYLAGTGNILAVVSAQSSLADARAKQAESVRNWFSALSELSYFAGRL